MMMTTLERIALKHLTTIRDISPHIKQLSNIADEEGVYNTQSKSTVHLKHTQQKGCKQKENNPIYDQ